MLISTPSNRYMAEIVNVLDNTLRKVEHGAKRNKRNKVLQIPTLQVKQLPAQLMKSSFKTVHMKRS